MKCPHCLDSFFPAMSDCFLSWDNGRGHAVTDSEGHHWKYQFTVCPSCKRVIIWLRLVDNAGVEIRSMMVWPKGTARAPLPKEVDEKFASDYRQACLVLADSPNASAALGRRCLQRILREKAGIGKSNLYDEIEQVITSKTLPSDLAEALHTVMGPRCFRSPSWAFA